MNFVSKNSHLWNNSVESGHCETLDQIGGPEAEILGKLAESVGEPVVSGELVNIFENVFQVLFQPKRLYSLFVERRRVRNSNRILQKGIPKELLVLVAAPVALSLACSACPLSQRAFIANGQRVNQLSLCGISIGVPCWQNISLGKVQLWERLNVWENPSLEVNSQNYGSYWAWKGSLGDRLAVTYCSRQLERRVTQSVLRSEYGALMRIAMSMTFLNKKFGRKRSEN